jgi:hypothetical protein
MAQQKMSPEALERLRRTRREQRIGQRTKRRNLIRARSKRLKPSELPGAPPVLPPVPMLNCGICNRKLRGGHNGSALCKPCYERDVLDESIDLSTLWLPPTEMDLVCAGYDYEEDGQ